MEGSNSKETSTLFSCANASLFNGIIPGGGVVKNLPANARHKRNRFNPWVRKIPWRRKWQPTPIFLPGKFHGQRSLAATVRGIKDSQTRLSEHTPPQVSCKRQLGPSTLSESKSPSSSLHCLFQPSNNTKRASTRLEAMPDIVDTPENKSTCPQMASV